MATPRVVETLNVLRDPEGGRRPGLPIVAVDQLVFDRKEELICSFSLKFFFKKKKSLDSIDPQQLMSTREVRM